MIGIVVALLSMILVQPTLVSAAEGQLAAPNLKRVGDISLDWNDVSGAAGYNVYRNDRYLTTVTASKYQDVGSGTYYVTAFDSSKQKFSPKSNKVQSGVASQPSGFDRPPTVRNTVITWVNNGWHEVQTKDGVTVCQGAPPCDVAAQGFGSGYYRVINHTNGKRFPLLKVGIKPDSLFLEARKMTATISVHGYLDSTVELHWAGRSKNDAHIDGWEVFRDGKLWLTTGTDSWFAFDSRASVDQVVYYELRAFGHDLSGKRVNGPKSVVQSPVLESNIENMPNPMLRQQLGTSVEAQQATQAIDAANTVLDRTQESASEFVVEYAEYILRPPSAGINPGGDFWSKGKKLWNDLLDLVDFRGSAIEKMKKANECLQTSSCRYPSNGNPGNDNGTPANIPGTNTPGECNEGGCWPA